MVHTVSVRVNGLVRNASMRGRCRKRGWKCTALREPEKVDGPRHPLLDSRDHHEARCIFRYVTHANYSAQFCRISATNGSVLIERRQNGLVGLRRNPLAWQVSFRGFGFETVVKLRETPAKLRETPAKLRETPRNIWRNSAKLPRNSAKLPRNSRETARNCAKLVQLAKLRETPRNSAKPCETPRNSRETARNIWRNSRETPAKLRETPAKPRETPAKPSKPRNDPCHARGSYHRWWQHVP